MKEEGWERQRDETARFEENKKLRKGQRPKGAEPGSFTK
jgi:hypothetical protein